ncbi:MAG: desulfoferrodoxin family protein [Candidatus Limivicinus sp.]
MSLCFKICRRCGNLVEMVHNSKIPVICCGEPMEELVPNSVEASGEKHVPVVTENGTELKVSVGSAAHPMLPEHFIQWIVLETDQGVMRKNLQPGEAPSAVFNFGEARPIAVYAYCNLHGLWKTEL